MKKSLPVRHAALDRELPQFKKRERGWIYVWDETDRVSYAHHWLDNKPVIHKGGKP